MPIESEWMYLKSREMLSYFTNSVKKLSREDILKLYETMLESFNRKLGDIEAIVDIN
jgi:hypothetical protein